jgi:DNA-binding HxlR family transcriptional regulator
MARKENDMPVGNECPVARALDVIGDRWSLLIVRDAFDGRSRFGEFQKNLGIARNILTDRLRTLVEQGIFEVVPASDGTAYQEYALTSCGRALFPVVVGLRQWGEDHLFARGDVHSVMIERKSGKPIRRMEPRGHNGRPLLLADTVVRKVSPS